MNRARILLTVAALGCTASLLVPAGGCASMGFTSDTKALIKQASFDNNCPEDKVSVTRSMEGGVGTASFVLDVCGTEKHYKRMGSSYFDESKGAPGMAAAPGKNNS